MEAPDDDLEFIRAATSVLVSLAFFEHGEAASKLTTENIQVSYNSIHLAVTLRKGKTRVAHTLTYKRNPNFKTSLIDLVLRYNKLRRSTATISNYYWALPGNRHTPTARHITMWLQFCLQRINVQPTPQVVWSSHSLRQAAASESAAIGVQEYRIVSWGDWTSARTFRESYLDGRVQACEDSYFFFGHLL